MPRELRLPLLLRGPAAAGYGRDRPRGPRSQLGPHPGPRPRGLAQVAAAAAAASTPAAALQPRSLFAARLLPRRFRRLRVRAAGCGLQGRRGRGGGGGERGVPRGRRARELGRRRPAEVRAIKGGAGRREGGAGGVGGERAPGRRGRLDARPERHSRGEQRRRAGGGRVPAPSLLRPAPRSPQLLRPRRDQPPPRLASGKCGAPPPLPGPVPGPRQGEPGHSLGTAENHSPLQRPRRDLRPRARPRPARSAREAGALRGGPQAGPRRPAQKRCLTWACGQSRSPSCATKPSAGRRATAEWRAMVPGEWNAKGRRQAHPRSQQQMAGDPWHRFLRSLWEARLGLRRRVENVLQRHLPRHPPFGLLAQASGTTLSCAGFNARGAGATSDAALAQSPPPERIPRQ